MGPGMDVLSIKPNTITVEIKHPKTGLPIGLDVECVSLESDECKVIDRQFRNKALRSGRNAMTAEGMEKHTVSLLAAAIVGWRWYAPERPKGEKGPPLAPATLGGDANPALTTENKNKLLEIAWIAKQIDGALGDEAAFFTTSETS